MEPLEANIEEMDMAFEDTLAEMGVSRKFAVRDIMRVLANNLVTLSWPKSAKIGRSAIDSDLDKIFNTLDDPDVLEYFAARFGSDKMAKSGKLKGKKRKATAGRELRGVKFNWEGNMSRMKGWHQSHRWRGKVRTQNTTVKRIGPWQFGSGMYVTKTALKKYKRIHVYPSVGKFKAGWYKGARALALLTGGRSTIPAFVRKQRDKRGAYIDKVGDKGVGYIAVVNKIPYATKLGRFIIGRAQRKTETYAANATKKQSESVVERFNARKAKARA